MLEPTCSLSECDKPVKRAGFCYGHYMKNWRYGTPTPTFPSRADDYAGRRFGSLVVTSRKEGRWWVCLCDCGAETRADVGNLNRGTKRSCGDTKKHWRQADITYGSAHMRVRADRGPAREFDCSDCGGPAQHWSYNHDDPSELTGLAHGTTTLMAYSTDPAHYSPRCIPCHKRFDLDHIDAMAHGR